MNKMNIEWNKIKEALSETFPLESIQWRPGFATRDKSKIKAIPYCDARQVQERLDAVVPGEWSFAVQTISAQERGIYVLGRLTVLGISREDVGEAENEQEPIKSAVSDAFKRCAVMFGIGRFLYNLPDVWVDAKEVGGSLGFADPADPLKVLRRLLGEQKKSEAKTAEAETEAEGEITAKQIAKLCAVTKPLSTDLLKELLRIKSFNDLDKEEASARIEAIQSDGFEKWLRQQARKEAERRNIPVGDISNWVDWRTKGRSSAVKDLTLPELCELVEAITTNTVAKTKEELGIENGD